MKPSNKVIEFLKLMNQIELTCQEFDIEKNSYEIAKKIVFGDEQVSEEISNIEWNEIDLKNINGKDGE